MTSRGQFGQDLFTLRSTYFEGRPPKSVNMHWRRFRIADIPTHEEAAFAAWLLARWREKDDLIEHYLEHGRFPADAGVDSVAEEGAEPRRGAGWIETEVRSKNPLEVFLILVPVAAFALVVNVCLKVGGMVLRVLRVR